MRTSSRYLHIRIRRETIQRTEEDNECTIVHEKRVTNVRPGNTHGPARNNQENEETNDTYRTTQESANEKGKNTHNTKSEDPGRLI